MFKRKSRKTKKWANITFNPNVPQDKAGPEVKLISLKKADELKVRRFLRDLTGAPAFCKILHNDSADKWIFIDIKNDKFPEYTGSPPTWKFPDYSRMPAPRWFKINGKSTHSPWPQPTYVGSTQRIEIGIEILNHIKLFIQQKKKSKFKLDINGRVINLPNLKLGRYIIKNHPQKNTLKIIE